MNIITGMMLALFSMPLLMVANKQQEQQASATQSITLTHPVVRSLAVGVAAGCISSLLLARHAGTSQCFAQGLLATALLTSIGMAAGQEISLLLRSRRNSVNRAYGSCHAYHGHDEFCPRDVFAVTGIGTIIGALGGVATLWLAGNRYARTVSPIHCLSAIGTLTIRLFERRYAGGLHCRY
ncbi:hypothetical protein M1466_00285 [Candidatus Dependentiae bacterium]|nr:hypothetical protein [Candidatus Dependentiae bacterium]